MSTYCGVSVDNRTAPGDDDIGRWDHLRRGERPRASHTRSDRVVAPLSVVWASITVSQRYPGIHRHPTVRSYDSTPQMAHGSLSLCEPVSFAANLPLEYRPLAWASAHTTRFGSRLLRLTENHPRDLEHFRHMNPYPGP